MIAVREVSVVIVPGMDGSTKTPGLFSATTGNDGDIPVSLSLMETEVDPQTGAIWLR